MPPATTSDQALQNLQAFQGQMKSGSDLLTSQENKLGVPGAQSQVSGLRQAITNTTNLLNQIPSSVYGRAANSLVTSGQAGRQIQNEAAPVQSKLQSQGQQESQAASDLQQLLGKATTGAQLDLQDQQTRLGLLQNIYQNIFGKEQAAAAQQLEQQKLQEQIREANMAKSSGGGGGGIDLGSLLGGGSAAGGAQMQQRTGGGFNFQSAQGTGINAADYAHAKNIPFRTLLQQMAGAGDTGASRALRYVGNDYGVNVAKLRQENAGTSYRDMVRLLRSMGARI